MTEPSSGLLRLGVGRLIARARAPYFRAALLGMIPVEVHGLGTLGITKDFVLYYDPEAVAKLDDEEVAFVLLHELFHPLNKHWSRGAGHPPAKVNIAGDLAVNQIVRAMGFRPPPGILWPKAFSFPTGLGMEGYLALLPDDVQAPDDAQAGDGEPKPGEPKIPGLCRGRCGSGAGNPIPGEPQPGDEGSVTGRSPAEVESIRRRTAEAVQSYAEKHRGTVPNEIVRWAGEVLSPPKIPWEQKLATLCRHAVAFRPGALDYRYTAISRRQAGIGFGPGKPVLPALRAPRPRVAFLVDTSGSMGTAELDRALAEGRGVLTALGAEMTFLANDASLHVVQRVRDWRKMRALLVGGGGTDLRPAFDAIAKMAPRPEIVVCVTDGLVGDGIPKVQLPGLTTIFVLVGKHRRRPCEWGYHVEVDDEPARTAP